MSIPSPQIPDSFLSKSFPELVHGEFTSAFAEKWIGADIEAYRLESLIGSGAHGVVFRALRTDPYEATVAIKLFPALQGKTHATSRFHEECQALADLDHPRITRILTAGVTEDGMPYLVMSFVQGVPIDDHVKGHQSDFARVASLARQLAGAVAFAHDKDFVHCDLKPDNILVDEAGDVTVTDFGLAVRLDRLEELVERPSWAPGTIGYCAPEILTSRQNASPKVDIYSLGAVLYKLLTGMPPHNETGWLDSLAATAERQVDPVRSRNQKVPTRLAEICDHCLAYDPKNRFASADEIESQLTAFLSSQSDSGKSLRRLALFCVASVTFLVSTLGLAFVLMPDRVGSLLGSAAPQAEDPDSLPEEEVDRVLEQIERQLLRPGLKDPAKPGDFEGTFVVLKAASEELDDLLEQAPTNKRVRERTAIGYFLLGRAAHWVKEDEYADDSLAKSEQMFRQLHRDYPNDGYMFDFFHTILVQATRAPDLEKPTLLLLALGIIQGLHEQDEANLDYADALACTHTRLADRYVTESSGVFDLKKASSYARKAYEIANRTCSQPNCLPMHRKHIMTSASVLCDVARFRGDPAESLRFAAIARTEAVRLEQAVQSADAIADRYVQTRRYVVALAGVGRLKETLRFLNEADDLAEQLIELKWPNCQPYREDMRSLRQSIEEQSR